MAGPVILDLDFADGSLSGFGSAGLPWATTLAIYHDAPSAAVSGPIGAGQSSTLSLAVTIAPGSGTARFWWRFDTAGAGVQETATFSVDGAPVSTSGVAFGWVEVSTVLTAGDHVLTWTTARAALSALTATLYLDDIEIEQTSEQITVTLEAQAVDDAVSTTAVIYEPDHIGRAFERLPLQYHGPPRIEALIEALAHGAQILEDLAWSVLLDRRLDVAAGHALEQWGAIVGEDREALDDHDYRRAIRARTLVLLCDGGPADQDQLLARLTEPSTVISASVPPAHVTRWAYLVDPLTGAMKTRIVRLMEQARPAGIGQTVIEVPIPGYFGFLGDPDALGFDAGALAEVIYGTT